MVVVVDWLFVYVLLLDQIHFYCECMNKVSVFLTATGGYFLHLLYFSSKGYFLFLNRLLGQDEEICFYFGNCSAISLIVLTTHVVKKITVTEVRPFQICYERYIFNTRIKFKILLILIIHY